MRTGPLIWILLALLAMLGSQAVQALEGGCDGPSPVVAHSVDDATARAMAHCCNEAVRQVAAPDCGLRSITVNRPGDAARMLTAAPPVRHGAAFARPPLALRRSGRPGRPAPRVRPHRPTAHPATLLLI